MNVVLINPSLGIWIRAKTLPLGLAYVAAVLEKSGHKVFVIDKNVTPKATIPKNTDVVAVTATTPVVEFAWKELKEAKKHGIITIIGGPHVTSLPEESASLPFVDYIIRGEGEVTIVELLERISHKKSIDEVDGLTFKNEDGHVVHTPDRAFIRDLDLIPFPAYHLFPDLKLYTGPQPLLGNKTPTANLMTSRGCPYSCSFCYKKTFGSLWRFRSPENVVQEWELLVKGYGVKEIAIQDDIFNTDLNRSIKIAKLICEKNLVVPWTTPNGIRADYVSADFFKAIKKSGCQRVSFGIESGSQEVLDKIIDKKIKLEDVLLAIELAKEEKIETLGFFVLGSPKESEEQMKETLAFSLKSGLDYAQFTRATPFPGTKFYHDVIREGRFKTQSWSQYSQFDSCSLFEHPHIDSEKVSLLIKQSYRKFYFRPRVIWNFARRLKTWLNVFTMISAYIHFIVKGK